MRTGDTVKNVKSGNVGEYLYTYPCGKFARVKIVLKDFISFERVRVEDLREVKNGKS